MESLAAASRGTTTQLLSRRSRFLDEGPEQEISWFLKQLHHTKHEFRTTSIEASSLGIVKSGTNKSSTRSSSSSLLHKQSCVIKAVWTSANLTLELFCDLARFLPYSSPYPWYVEIHVVVSPNITMKDSAAATVPWYAYTPHEIVADCMEAINAAFEAEQFMHKRNASVLRMLQLLENTLKNQLIERINQHMLTPPSLESMRHDVEVRILQDIQRNLQGIDFLLSLFGCTLQSNRKSTFLQPFPDMFKSNVDQGRTRNHNHKDFVALKEAFDGIPSLQHIQRHGLPILKTLPPSVLSLLDWLTQRLPVAVAVHRNSEDFKAANVATKQRPSAGFSSASSALAAPSSSDKPFVVFDVQQSEDPVYSMLAEKYGVQTGYHGSAVENFYSILMNGLQNWSGTHRMKSGAVFGDGIYFAEDVQVARHFMTPTTKMWSKRCVLFNEIRCMPFAFVQDLMSMGVDIQVMSSSLLAEPPQSVSKGRPLQYKFSCLVKCEFINHPESLTEVTEKTGSTKKEDSYYVVSDPCHIRIQALYVYRHLEYTSFFHWRREWTSLKIVAVSTLILLMLSAWYSRDRILSCSWYFI